MEINKRIEKSFKVLQECPDMSISSSKLEDVQKTVHQFALYSVGTSFAGNFIPGVGAIAVVAAQTTLIWSMYVKLNKQLGINISDNKLKFIGSAMVANIGYNAGYIIVSYAAAVALGFIPILGQYLAGPIEGIIGYITIYLAAILYIQFLTKVMNAKGKCDIDNEEEAKQMIGDIAKEANFKELISEAKKSYKHSKKNGEVDQARKEMKCPNCGNSINSSEQFCSHCGTQLKTSNN